MIGVLLATALAAPATPAAQHYAWEISFLGEPVGERTLDVTFARTQDGLERVFKSTTTIDARSVDFEYVYQMNLAARAKLGPASFNSSVARNADSWSTELRWSSHGLYLTHVDGQGVAVDKELPPTAADLSTADLFDPLSQVPLTRFESVQVMSAETGEIWSSRVRRLGPSEVDIEGTLLLVEGVVLHPPEGRTALYYTAEGVPVRYEYYVDGRLFEAVLQHLPPPGVDESPVPVARPDIATIDLE